MKPVYYVIREGTTSLLVNRGFRVYEDALTEARQVGGIVTNSSWLFRKTGKEPAA